MRAIIIGLGSMGRRRTRLLKEYDSSIDIVGIDTKEKRRNQAKEELGIQTSESIQSVCKEGDVDLAFISAPPLAHADIIKECLEEGLHVFTELNLTNKGYDENIQLAKNLNRVLFLSSTFLYREEIRYIKDEVDKSGCPLTYLYHAGQYLSDWHPWESYKNYFVGNKATNGCREFMAIEIPWLIDVFGKIKFLYSKKARNSTLEIEFPDTYQIMFEHESGHRGMILIDVVSRKAVRSFELSGENLYLTWDGTPDGVMNYNYEKKENVNVSVYNTVEHRDGYSPFIIENAYKSEMENFMNVVKNGDTPRYSFEKDKYVLSIIDEIERG